ncbi:MAG: hypothetical protein GX434_12970 [Peptococcaceae bacterium]|nr:hypothetical protein [Peptococcaceae bacterium]
MNQKTLGPIKDETAARYGRTAVVFLTCQSDYRKKSTLTFLRAGWFILQMRRQVMSKIIIPVRQEV